ncbi:Sec63 complex subunit SEC66 [Saccharomyces eubayanus]|uniref:Sec63 complex subunit SEC66 n=1 Tax=Saccharomyces eubayanus TaxID=1080349 RepID=UPI0006C21EF3|nr:SEC66-like protein [Saccharomyces eubayanus]KOH00488.1 SEC66-like protein [Saccharomyces eubayanus]
MSEFNETKFSSNGTFTENEEPIVETKVISVYTPLIYVFILVVSLVMFASNYRKKQAKKISEQPSIFDENDAHDLFFQIKEMSENEKVHEKVLKAALLNRGAESVRRSLKLKELAPQINLLYKNGSIGEDYWKRFETEVKLIELEFKDTLQEAERLQPGWAQLFVMVCKEICFNQALSRRYRSILKRKEVCIEEWELKINDDGRLVE